MAEAMMKSTYAHHIGMVDSCGMDDGGDIGDGFTIAVMQEVGLDLMDHEPKSFANLELLQFDLVICFSEASYEEASRIPMLANAAIEYWPVYDMELIAEGREARLNAYRNVRDDIKTMLNDRFEGLNA
jgi:protein-tyrosine-phosphatase